VVRPSHVLSLVGSMQIVPRGNDERGILVDGFILHLRLVDNCYRSVWQSSNSHSGYRTG